MAERKREREDDFMNGASGPEVPTISKEDAMLSAMANVRALAKQAQLEALQTLQNFEAQLDTIWASYAGLALTERISRGDQSLVVVLKVLARTQKVREIVRVGVKKVRLRRRVIWNHKGN